MRKSRAFIGRVRSASGWAFEALGQELEAGRRRNSRKFTPQLGEAMRQEPILVFESLLKENGSLLTLLDARETWLNEPLARHYGISGVRGDEMRRVKLDDANRGGLLGMASVLTVTSSASRTSPVVPREVGARNAARRKNAGAAAGCRHPGAGGGRIAAIARCARSCWPIAATHRAPCATTRSTRSASGSRISTRSALSAAKRRAEGR